MAVLTRVTDFVPSTLIKSQEVDDELNQLVNLLSGVSTTNDTLLKFSDGSNPVLRVDQLGAGVIQQWLQNGSVKSRINNNGSLESIAGPVIAASQTITAPLTIDGTPDIVLKANGFIVGYRRSVRSAIVTVGNVGTGLDTLDSYDLPANSLPSNQDSVRVIYFLTFASNDTDKRVALTVGGTLCLDTGLIDLDQQGALLLVDVFRIDSTHVQLNFGIIEGLVSSITSAAVVTSNGAAFRVSSSIPVTVSDLASNVLNFLVQAEGAANNDIVLNTVEVGVLQMS